MKQIIEIPYRLPRSVIHFNSTSTTLHGLVSYNGYGADSYPWCDRMLGRFPIPKWQRPLVWTEEQKVSFIDSVYLGYDLGSVIINDYEEVGKGILRPMSDILIDGQQRVGTLLSFINNEFPYAGLYWRDLNRRERRRLLEREMGKRTARCFDEEELKKVYNHLNFSGTAHSPDQAA